MIKRIAAVLALGLTFSSTAHAGLYTDDLARCLVDSTSKDDRMALVRWMFVAAAAHPAVASIAKVSPKERDEADKKLATLFMRLLTDTCKDKAQKAIATDGGAVAIQQSFAVLGQVAARDLFSSPEVAQSMTNLDKYVDKKALESLK